MFMCVVNLKSVNKLDLTWKQSFLIFGEMVARDIIVDEVRFWCPSSKKQVFMTFHGRDSTSFQLLKLILYVVDTKATVHPAEK